VYVLLLMESGQVCIWIFANNKIYWVISASVSKREKFAWQHYRILWCLWHSSAEGKTLKWYLKSKSLLSALQVTNLQLCYIFKVRTLPPDKNENMKLLTQPTYGGFVTFICTVIMPSAICQYISTSIKECLHLLMTFVFAIITLIAKQWINSSCDVFWCKIWGSHSSAAEDTKSYRVLKHVDWYSHWYFEIRQCLHVRETLQPIHTYNGSLW